MVYPYLQVADGRSVVDLDVGDVGIGESLAVSEPADGGPRMGQHLSGDVDGVPLPGVPGDGALDLGSVWRDGRAGQRSTREQHSSTRAVETTEATSRPSQNNVFQGRWT